MQNFIIGLIIGIFIGTGGTMVLTQQDLTNAQNRAVELTQDAKNTLSKYVDQETVQKIIDELETGETEKDTSQQNN